jgi:hypothetical protein
MKCLKFASLIDYLDDRLDVRAGAVVAAHIAGGCPECSRTRQWYLSVRAIAASDDCIDPPAWVVKRAIRLFSSARAPSTIDKVKQLIASLVFDSLSRPVTAGVRLTESSVRQLLYRADAYSIDLQIAPREEAAAALHGQVLREGETRFDSVSNLRIELADGDRILHSVLTNEMGEFELEQVAHGDYELRIGIREAVLIIPQLVIA